ncbi:MAG: heparin lyase I family protein, partial [Bacteroidota bacterium]
YADDFEIYSNIGELIDGDNELWSFSQLTRAENVIMLDTSRAHTGNYSVRFEAEPTTAELGASKASINKQFMAFWEGEIVEIRAWYYIPGQQQLEWLFLFDLEEKVSIGAGPGMRLALVDNALALEHKYPNPNVFQPEANKRLFPRNSWVQIRMETLLSQQKEGWVKIWQNDTLIIDQSDWQTLPRDFLYSQQGTKGMYNQIEFGITANTDQGQTMLYLDDISVRTK